MTLIDTMRNGIKERYIGEVFDVGGMTVKVVESASGCLGCAIKNCGAYKKIIGICSAAYRTDYTSIILKQIIE